MKNRKFEESIEKSKTEKSEHEKSDNQKKSRSQNNTKMEESSI